MVLKTNILTMKYIAALLFATLLFASCSSFRVPNFSKIKIGMTPEQVIKQLGNKYTVISAKKYEDGVLEIYQFSNVSSIDGNTDASTYNWLFFFNNKLEEWGPKENFQPYDYYNRRHHN